MIGTVTLDAGGERHTVKLSASAMYRLEQKSTSWSEDGEVWSISKILAQLDDFSMTRFAPIFAEIMNEGKGASLDDALDLMDKVNFADAVRVFEDASVKAFPDAKKTAGTTQRKNAKGATRSK